MNGGMKGGGKQKGIPIIAPPPIIGIPIIGGIWKGPQGIAFGIPQKPAAGGAMGNARGGASRLLLLFDSTTSGVRSKLVRFESNDESKLARC